MELERPSVIVAGFGGCGSTMLMGMLDSGGYHPYGPVAADSYEMDPSLVSSAVRGCPSGQAVKALDVRKLSPRVPRLKSRRVIVLRRGAESQAASLMRRFPEFWAAMGVTESSGPRWDRLVDSFRTDFPALMIAARSLGGVHVFDYEDFVADPLQATSRLAEVLPGLDVESAAAVVETDRAVS